MINAFINFKIYKMKKFFLALTVVFSVLFVKADPTPDEGMWLPMLVQRLNYVDMQKMGLHLTAEELYSVNHSSLKDAVVSLGGFCTAEVVSPDGLLFTNHHCGYDAIQKHSSVEHDYLTDGFWAMNKNEELPNEGLSVSFLVRMDDMTQKVLSVLKPGMTEDARNQTIMKKIAELKKENSENGKYRVEIKPFFNGSEYYMFIYQVYKDIRLVGAPPSAIGKFGGDTDNWMWPRHTGDFSIFRIYAAPDGSPAEYSKNNVPLKVKKFLPVSIKGFQKNDFAMIWGFPGTTDRYRNSWAVNATLNEMNPVLVEGLGKILECQKKGMDADAATRIQYASNYAGLANFWKNKIGETRDLKRLNVIGKKQKVETRLRAWIAADPQRQNKYGNMLKNIEDVYTIYTQQQLYKNMYSLRMLYFGSQTFVLPSQTKSLEQALKNNMKADSLNLIIKEYKDMALEHFKDYNVNVEKDIYASLLKMIKNNISKQDLPDIFNTIDGKYKGNIDAFVNEMFKTSLYASKQNFEAFLAKPAYKVIEKDLAYQTYNSIDKKFMEILGKSQDLGNKNAENQRLFVAALREMEPNKSFYPDANSTMRMTYGKVTDYFPADGILYKHYTTLDGVMAKEDPKNEEFIVPGKLKTLWQHKDYGQYAENGKMITCFLTDNDITGGNSGSPVLNGNGELIGIAFDGNWEAMSGNIFFETELQRTINVDIRYVLFVIDKYAGATNLIKELTIVK